ncbi:hypothetical protein BZG01_02795 [Labilibaculum manganireducens]|uniref:Uncharacterized protein n=1 Tax=Labilibaculum manganireducens TaxID=1940525 RepID=A0A2N3IEI4_9BACT|nr:hypothetical protein [Labilibaculum manganireducens]PKQ68663.1 hypothetical protein BZG01_02795 [Labilibaculum manganireducens]
MIQHFKILTSILIIQLLLACSYSSNKENNKIKDSSNISFADSLWMKFAAAIEEGNLEFLVNNSFDTIQCVDCISENNDEKEFYQSKIIFQNYLDKLMHLDNLTNKEFSTFMNDSIIRVSYNIKWKTAPEGAYGLVFSFAKKNEKFYFDGMFTIP